MKQIRKTIVLVMVAALLLTGGCSTAKPNSTCDSAKEKTTQTLQNNETPRHKVIIDTDTGSDDAAALVLAATSDCLDILGVTVLYGNVPLNDAAKNALMTLELCDTQAPVYIGAKKPLTKEREEMISVHGKDGMGDQNLIRPKRSAEDGEAVC